MTVTDLSDPQAAASVTEEDGLEPTTESSEPTAERWTHQGSGRLRRTRATFHIPIEVVEEARDAVMFLQQRGIVTSLADVVQRALERELEEMRRQHNGGATFPLRNGQLKGGRPRGA